MLAAEGDLAALLDGDEAALSTLLAAVREPWLARGLVALVARSACPRALELLARAPDHHARHALDALADMMRAGPAPDRRHAAAALAALAARRPPWLHRLAAHDAAQQLLRLLRPGRDPRAALHALLALAALLDAARQAAAALWPELGDAFVRLAAAPAHPHLAVGAHALFRALYEAHPCGLLERLRVECAHNEPLRRALPPLLDSVRLHPKLVLGAREDPDPENRWPNETPATRLRPAPASPRGPPPRSPAPPTAPRPTPPAPPAPGDPAWFCLSERCGAESAPHTPQPAAEGSPPEAAVEATPENTPVKEARAAFQFPTGRVSPGGASGRLARVVLERSRAVGGGSPVPLGAAPPAGCVRVRALRQEEAADREVRELTAGARRGGLVRGAPRARSCPPRVHRAAGAGSRREVGCQTEEAWPALSADLTPADLSLTSVTVGPESQTVVGPTERLDDYLYDLYRGDARTPADPRPPGDARPPADLTAERLAEQLALTHALLQYERWRRDAHAERNRRLLGKCRAARALEQDNEALRQRARTLQAELDTLRARPAAPRAPPAPPVEHDLAGERDARLRAEAAAHAAEAERDRARAELGAARARLGDQARRLEAEGRWARAASKRAAAAAALKRELLARGEREARLASAAKQGLARIGEAAEARRAAASARDEAAAALSAAAAAEARAASAEARAADLEAALGAREAALGACRREARAAGEAAAARLVAVQDKYRAVQHALRRVHLRRLEALAGGAGGAARGGESASPLSASLAEGGGRSPPLSDLSRHLLDDDEAAPP